MYRQFHHRKRAQLSVERLEARTLLTGHPLISELVASNNNSHVDGDGADPDWIELFNPTGADVELGGWYLTDDQQDLTKWRFPEFTLPAGHFETVFASGRNAPDRVGHLHTNFRLRAAGDYVALVKPDGTTVASEFAAGGENFPEQFEDVSYGIQFETQPLVAPSADVDILIPSAAADDAFDDNWRGGNEQAFQLAGGLAGWQKGITSVGHAPADAMTAYRDAVAAEPSLLSFYTFENDSTALVGIRDVAGTIVKNGTFVCIAQFDDAACQADAFASGIGGADGRALSLNGGGMVSLGAANDFLFEDGDGTIEAWLRPRGGGSFFATRISPRGNLSNRYSLHIDDASSVIQKQAQSFAPMSAAYDAPDESWIHVVAVFEGQSTSVFVNGDQVTDVDGSGDLGAITDGLTSQIGTSTIERLIVDGFRGEIDELAIYADPLVPATIRDHFRQVQLIETVEFGTDIGDDMRGTHTSAYLRVPFEVADPATMGALHLDIGYNDGFVAFINGVAVAQRNAPEQLNYQSSATATHEIDQRDVFNVSAAISSLRAGENVLAIHGLNHSDADEYFFVDPVLVGTTVLSDQVRFFVTPTPNSANQLPGVLDLVRPVTFDVEHGFYTEAFDVRVTTATPGATLVYTTDGSHPALENGTVVSPPSATEPPAVTLTVSDTTTLRAAAFRDDWEPSAAHTATYLFLRDLDDVRDLGQPVVGTPAGAHVTYEMDAEILNDPRFGNSIIDALLAIPTMSVVVDPTEFFGPTGIYITGQGEREGERRASVEYFTHSGDAGFSIDAGIRIAGAGARNFAKRPLRLVFRDEYGQGKLRFPLFSGSPVDEFDTLNLRSGGHDSWLSSPRSESAYLRDPFARLTHQDMGQLSPRSQAVHLYINGRYWGVYYPTERPEENYHVSHFGGERADWDVLRTQAAGNFPEAVNGDTEAWERILQRAGSSQAAYDELLESVDIDNYIDSLIVRMVLADQDWGGEKNYFAARNRDGGQFKFYTWDAEFIMGNTGHRVDQIMTGVGGPRGPGAIHGAIAGNPEYRLRFADRIQQHLFHDGALTVEKNQARWDALIAEWELAIVGESARWGDELQETPLTVDDWQEEVDWVRNEFLAARTDIMIEQFRNAGLLATVDAPVMWVNGTIQRGGDIQAGDELTFQVPEDGVIYYTMDGSDPREIGGAVSPQAVEFTGPLELADQFVLKARRRKGAQWSALSVGEFQIEISDADFSNLRVSEVHYNPGAASNAEIAAGYGDSDEFEFIELVNISDEPIDLTSLRLVRDTIDGNDRGVDFAFANSVVRRLAPGDTALVVENVDAFTFRYGDSLPVAGQWSGGLDDDTETITLMNAAGSIVQQFAYDDGWHTTTDGAGHSLEFVDPSAPDPNRWSIADGWRASVAVNGTPGAVSFDLPGDFDGDQQIDEHDIDLLAAAIRAGQDDPRFDLNHDGLINSSDRDQLIREVLESDYGDSTLDGVFDDQDIVAVFIAGKYLTSEPAGWAQGDWNGDGWFDEQDIVASFVAGSYLRGAADEA